MLLLRQADDLRARRLEAPVPEDGLRLVFFWSHSSPPAREL
jgi:hypothetical protein